MFWDDDSWLIVAKCFHMFSSRWFLGHFRGRDSIVMVFSADTKMCGTGVPGQDWCKSWNGPTCHMTLQAGLCPFNILWKCYFVLVATFFSMSCAIYGYL